MFGDYQVFSPTSKRTYRVALRGVGLFDNYCACSDYAVNTLGTCKHIEAVLLHARSRFGGKVEKSRYRRKHSTIYLDYRQQPRVRISSPVKVSAELFALREEFFDGDGFLKTQQLARVAEEKTIQAIGVAEMLARRRGIGRALVICPASVKHQWLSEIKSFSDHGAVVIDGSPEQRRAPYNSDAFFKIVIYALVRRDLENVSAILPDLIVLDEAQRIRNWKTAMARTIELLCSRYALVLTGTPLENKLEELYSTAQFVDGRRLGPAFRFLSKHRHVNEKGKLIGYRNLDQVRQKLARSYCAGAVIRS